MRQPFCQDTAIVDEAEGVHTGPAGPETLEPLKVSEIMSAGEQGGCQ